MFLGGFVQLLKSLFCWQGFDNRNRFFVIQSATYLSFIVLSSIFAHSVIFSFIVLALSIALCATTTRRRLNDSELNKTWLFAPCALLLLMGCIIIFTDHHSAYWLLILPALLSSLLLTYPAKNNKSYILGYFGPIDLSEFANTSKTRRTGSRIEPTLAHATNQQNYQKDYQQEVEAPFSHSVENTATEDSLSNEPDIGEGIRLALLQNRTTVIAIGSVLLLILSAVFISSFFSSSGASSTSISAENNQQSTVENKLERLHQVTLPDEFSLMLSPYNGLTIAWQADESNTDKPWSQLTAHGDKSCSVIKFNNGDTIRTLEVNVENMTQYFASFSPLDSNKIVKSLALRGSFSLCGYSFSLKGSQAVLGKHPKYADFLSS